MINLRDYQQKTVENVFSAYDNDVRSTIVNLATGAGKTHVSIELAKIWRDKIVPRLRQEGKFVGSKVAFVVDRIELAQQTKDSFLKADPTLRVEVEMADKTASERADVVIFSIQTVGRTGSKRITKFVPNDFGFIILDECHGATSASWKRLLTYFGVNREENFEDYKMLVGLTATPERSDGTSLGSLFEDIAAQFDTPYCIREGWLTDIEWIPIQTKTDISGVKTKGGEFVQSELSTAVHNPVRNAAILKAYKEICNGETAIFYCASVDHAYYLAEMFNNDGIPSECIEGETDKTDRKNWLKNFKQGDIKCIFNYAALTTGYDNTELMNVFFLRPIKSSVTYKQALGRGLRPSITSFIDFLPDRASRLEAIALSSKPVCRVIDFCDIVGSHNICTVPTLFGLNPKMVTNKKKFFNEVVEIIEHKKREVGFNPADIIDPDNIELILQRKKVKITQYTPDEVINKLSNLSWLPVGENEYELLLSKNNKTISVEPTIIGKFDLIETDLKSGVSARINTFTSLAGAIQNGDAYCKEVGYDVKFLLRGEWQTRGVSSKQANILKNLFKGGVQFGFDRYPDTGQRHVLLQGKLIETAGEASAIINQRFGKK